ncbi:MAG: ferrous iron transport protein B [Candidatus Omnitrophica bacterium]|nr:ferrous iron transport protein B [Candidatus Omnitrophota bacterium]
METEDLRLKNLNVATAPVAPGKTHKILILGSPNVGKSVLFNNLTGRYVTVSNYPGTTVEVSECHINLEGSQFEIIDTPGMYSFSPVSEEEMVTRRILLEETPSLVMHVIDAKNLERMLPLTLELLDAGLPVMLVLNMMDEARRLGMMFDRERLEKELGILVIETVSTSGEGMEELEEAIIRFSRSKNDLSSEIRLLNSDSENLFIEEALAAIENFLSEDYQISKRSIGRLLLKEDREVWDLIEKKEPQALLKIKSVIEETKARYNRPLELEMALALKREVIGISNEVIRRTAGFRGLKSEKRGFEEWLSRLTMNPVTGLPILFLILYLGLYQFVGVFGAKTVVDFLERTIFEGYINPFLIKLFSQLIPWPVFRDLFVGEYGMLTLGVRYAIALILPIVSFFFLVFAVIEDTGYLPRLAMLIDRIFKKIGLSGRAVIPMVLGFGCDTMATMVTRTLPTPRERVISTMLLSLAIPCSAQLGVIFALLTGHVLTLFLWAFVVGLVFLFIGFLTAQIMPGEKPSFYMELPPLRFPKITNVLTKTYVRVKWYFLEVLPLFIVASSLIWLGQLTGVFAFLIRLLAVPVKMIGLPVEASKMFLMGFFRRDYGAAGLYDLARAGKLNEVQLLVACVTLTLFLPCIAQFLMNMKERGWKTGLGISAFTLFFSFWVAFFLNFILVSLGVRL